MSKKEIEVALKRKALSLLDAIAQGSDEETACRRNGVNYGQYVKWVIQYPEFEKAVQTAKELRADAYKNKIARMALDENGEPIERDKDEVQSVKANFEMLKWLASVDNPDKYGQKTKIENTTPPTQIIIDTGIGKTKQKDESNIDLL